MIRVEGLWHEFSGRPVLRGVNLHVPRGERLALVGPNGAGKSTLLRVVASLLRPLRGTVEVDGRAYPDGIRDARRRIGYLGHDPQIYLDLTPWQNLRLFGDLHGVDGLDDRIPKALAAVGLLARAHDPVRTFSRGMAQRMGIARMGLHAPDLLLLDEPHTGLDADGARLLDGVIADAAQGVTVLMVTHDLARARALCQRIVMLHRGVVAWELDSASADSAALARAYDEATA